MHDSGTWVNRQLGQEQGQTMASESLKIIKSGPEREGVGEGGRGRESRREGVSLVVGAAVLSCQPKRNQAAACCRDTVRQSGTERGTLGNRKRYSEA